MTRCLAPLLALVVKAAGVHIRGLLFDCQYFLSLGAAWLGQFDVDLASAHLLHHTNNPGAHLLVPVVVVFALCLFHRCPRSAKVCAGRLVT